MLESGKYMLRGLGHQMLFQIGYRWGRLQQQGLIVSRILRDKVGRLTFEGRGVTPGGTEEVWIREGLSSGNRVGSDENVGCWETSNWDSFSSVEVGCYWSAWFNT